MRVPAHPGPVGLVGRHVADQDHRFGVLLAHELHHGQLALGVPAGGADLAQPVVLGGLRLDSLGDVGVVR